MEFLSSSNLEILNNFNEPTLCSGCKQEAIDINMGSTVLLESITSRKVSSELSLSDHRNILFTGLRTGTPDQKP